MTTTSLHSLLLLSDSALPLGSFAFSSGLESFLGHHRNLNASGRLQAFDSFLHQSLHNVAHTALPYVMTAFHSPQRLEDLDNDFDASTPCTVARRASVAQGRALLNLWQRALAPPAASKGDGQRQQETIRILNAFAVDMKTSGTDDFGLQLNAHFPPLFGTVCKALGLSEEYTAYLFLLNHAKALLSAAVRASVMGPYQSHAFLASTKLQTSIRECVSFTSTKQAEDAAVTVPLMDLWMGRHELLYSRIFNS
ncbi:urease accessory protein UreF [Polychaeton citri CBS 116435]|uniref:Urease accessory protein UreF n=1 Tax=Polychaeton citri CBS 116435 TaxID=1314669 RepID=A0A9P4UMG2_9PEZI|nr:urease accessory protein UreF [Polychaeton citri CBS 116435]